ncbi:uncharacterized protein LOC131985068 [Centropristis striata]|uniref:uncharacterized protein LOC131985068 n=1 Tax=Centropristis striata TaxID=184440 RepID=UPI0027DF2CA4|nr:uncharacterized protein LOC131985068 [Centropristis striata]
MFCKDECGEGNILVETEEDRAQSGRYSIKYKEGFYPASDTLLYVSITDLTKSDSGRYRCGLVRTVSFLSANRDFKIRVKDAPTSEKPKQTPRPPSVPPASTETTTQSSGSTSGSSSPSSASPETTTQSQQEQPADDGVPLYVGLTLVVMFIVFLVALLIYCRKRDRQPKAPPMETEYADVTEANRVYEEIREDRESRSPVEISTVYTYAKYAKPNEAETSDDTYSFATAATSQKNTEDDSSKLTYSTVGFRSDTAASLHSAPRGDADNVVYSVPRVE